MCADGRGDAVGIGQRDRVVERARAHGAGGDGMSVERGDQGELVAARGAVAACECVGGLRKLVDALVLGLLAGCAVAVLGAAKLRCPHCGKVLFQEAVKLRLAGETTCPKCGKSVTFQ